MADAQRIYWDSTVFEVLLHDSGERGRTCRRLLEDAEDGRLQIVTSFHTIAEVFRYHGEDDQPKPLPAEAGLQLQAFLENDYFLYVAIDRVVAERAQQICRQHAIEPPQALHLACALRAGARRLQTWNDALAGLSRRIGDPALVIGPPVWTGQLSLLESLFQS